jgi:intein/homing endonuclease
MGKVLGYGATDGDKDWIEIQFENGSTLTCTVDHPVYTENRGWVAAGDLTEDDDVRAY